jgi:endonuclease-8
MPEGPEIRLAADELAQALTGRPADAVHFAFESLKSFEATLTSQVVKNVEARGKAILIRFANGLNIYSHNQLYGKWIIRRAYTLPETNRQLRLAIHNTHKSALLYSASTIAVLRDDELETHSYLSKLGPDLLANTVSLSQVVDRLQAQQFQQRRLSTLLLDQGFLAGMGNYLRSEVLFVAGVHPSRRPRDCSPAQINQLAEAALWLTRQSYQTRGITNDLNLVKKPPGAGGQTAQLPLQSF